MSKYEQISGALYRDGVSFSSAANEVCARRIEGELNTLQAELDEFKAENARLKQELNDSRSLCQEYFDGYKAEHERHLEYKGLYEQAMLDGSDETSAPNDPERYDGTLF